MEKERLWTKDFVTVTMTNFLIYIVFYLLMVLVADFAVVTFHASPGIAGLVSGIFVIGILAGRLGTGHIVEKIGSRKLLLIGTLCFVITSALYVAAVNLQLLIIIRFLHGIAYGIASTATGTIVARIIPGQRKGEGISYYSMSQILATALGPLLGILLIQRVDYQMLFIVCSGIALISFGTAIIINPPHQEPENQNRKYPVKKMQISMILEFSAIPISVIVLIVGFNYSSVLSFLSLYSQELHLEKTASIFFVVYALIVIISRPFSGRLLDTNGPHFVVYPCLVLFAIGMLVLSQSHNGATLLLAGALIGLGYGNFLSCGQAIAIKRASSHRLGLATATYYIFLDIGFGVGPYIFGSLVPFVGYRGLYLVMAAMISVTVLLYYLIYRRRT